LSSSRKIGPNSYCLFPRKKRFLNFGPISTTTYDDDVVGICCELALRQFQSHLIILAFRSTIDGNSDDELPTPDFPTHVAVPPQPVAPSPRPPPQSPSALPWPLPLPPLTEPNELFESPKHTCEPVSESFFMIDLYSSGSRPR